MDNETKTDDFKAGEKVGYERGYHDGGAEDSKRLIYAALVKAQAKCKAAGKSGDNKYDGYKYAMLQDYVEATREPMSENELALTVDEAEIKRIEVRETSGGKKERAVEVKLIGHLVHKSGEELLYTAFGEGQDRSDKAMYKAITGAKKYLIANIFNIPTTDDPEKDSDTERDRDPMNQDNKPPKPQGATKPLMRPAARPEAPSQTQTAAPTQQAMTDAERKNLGLIDATQFDALKTLLKKKGIQQQQWKIWLKENYKIDSASKIQASDYPVVCNTVDKHPEFIMKAPAKAPAREPGVDENEPLPERMAPSEISLSTQSAIDDLPY